MTPDELAVIRDGIGHSPTVNPTTKRRCGCAPHRLLAHIDAITEAVEGMHEYRIEGWDGHEWQPMLDRAAVLALLRGTPQP